MAHKGYYGKKRNYADTGPDPEVKIKKEGGDSASVNGGDSAGFGGGNRYSVNQTKGIEQKAPVSGGGR